MSNLPKSLPKGTVFYYDETKEAVPWVGGLLEVEEWEKATGKAFSQLGGVDDMRRLAYFHLVRKGLIDPKKVSYEDWAPTVAWIFDDTPDGQGEDSPPAS